MAKNIDMTVGSIKGDILRFAYPLFLGNLFQQLYNAADSLIVGNTLGPIALASVSSSGPLVHMLVGFINGVGLGAGVVISKNYGAKNLKAVDKAIHTDLAFGLAAGVLLTFFGVAFTPIILSWMQTPLDIMPLSITYFKIYSSGLFFVVMYNICMGIMNALGDSKHPLYYLIISSVLNVVLDFVFILVFKLGVGSAALATVLSQGFSVVLCFLRLLKKGNLYSVRIKSIRFDLNYLKQIVNYGLPTGVQNSVIGFANIIVQTNINTFASFAVAASGAYSKLEGFAFLPITCFSLALTTFISQNLGAHEYERAKKGARFGILCSISMAEVIGLIVFLLAPNLISLFNNDPLVIDYGSRQIHIEALFFFALALSHCIAGILRGAGKAKIPMFIMMGSWCIFRVAYITTAIHFVHKVELVYAAYPITWSISSIAFLLYLKKADWIHGLENHSK